MSTHTPQQVLERDISILGDSFGRLYNAFKNEYFRLSVKWKEYKIVFGSSRDRIDMLNRIASFHFSQIQELMLNDIVLHINRMIYQKRTKSYDYLTIRRLPDCELDPRRKKQLQDRVENAVAFGAFSKDRRDRYIAHRSLELFTSPKTRPLDEIRTEQIESVLKSFFEVISYMEAEYFKSGIMDDVIFPLTGAFALMRSLEGIGT